MEVQAHKGALPKLFKKGATGAVLSWEIWVERTKRETGVMVTRYGHEEGQKQTLREEITDGKNAGRRNATTPYEQACLEAVARWNKQKDRKGYGLDVEESARVRGASPMLAQAYDKHAKKVAWTSAFAQPKLDGFRCLARKVGNKVLLTSRENQPLEAVGHLAELLKEILPDGLTLDGELYRHGLALNQISSACKRKSDLSRTIEYHVYDAVGEQHFGDRYRRVSELAAFVADQAKGLLVAVQTVKVRSEAELMRCQLAFIESGYEGAMLRYGKAGYEAGKRSSALLKVKTFQDDEFEIVDWKNGRGKYAGMPVFVCTTPDGNHFDVLAPGNLEEKLELGRKAAGLVGKMLKVKYQYFTKTDEPVPFLPVAVELREGG
jgi:DNA ligase-1